MKLTHRVMEQCSFPQLFSWTPTFLWQRSLPRSCRPPTNVSPASIPSIDPELLLRIPLLGYLYGIPSERPQSLELSSCSRTRTLLPTRSCVRCLRTRPWDC
jgi:hypothetical protein